jgi:hypothetical protein
MSHYLLYRTSSKPPQTLAVSQRGWKIIVNSPETPFISKIMKEKSQKKDKIRIF